MDDQRLVKVQHDTLEFGKPMDSSPQTDYIMCLSHDSDLTVLGGRFLMPEQFS